MTKHEDKKLEIIQKSSEIMYLKGYNATGVQELADAANIPKGSFYNYFKSKEDFAIDLMDSYCAMGCQMMSEILEDKSLTPLKRIEKLFSEMTEHFTKDEKFQKGSFVGNLCQEMGDISKPISKAAERSFNHMKEPIIKLLQEAQDAGEISKSHDIEDLAEFMMNSKEGALLRMKSSKNARPLKVFQDMIMRLLLIK
ncbi:MAG: TetR family transcriptional regulator C-terminal domain-containing protein [Candidatus Marinimicrobia bacterium]|nr:TetR family transcriptional regulator C-terminal domain-containing protein [Candidatus Neomarinimicrobiota bacterium]